MTLVEESIVLISLAISQLEDGHYPSNEIIECLRNAIKILQETQEEE